MPNRENILVLETFENIVSATTTNIFEFVGKHFCFWEAHSVFATIFPEVGKQKKIYSKHVSVAMFPINLPRALS